MQIEYKMTVRSHEAMLILDKIRIGKDKRTMVDLAIRKLALLLRLAREEEVYALVRLLEIKTELDMVSNQLQEAREQITNILLGKNINADKFSFAKKHEFTFRFGNPIVFQLIKIINEFDGLMCLLSLAHNTMVLDSRDKYFLLKNKYWNIPVFLLNNLMEQKTQEIPKISIEQYFEKASMHQEVGDISKKINPQTIANMLNLNVMKFMSEKRRDFFMQKLIETFKLSNL